MPPKKTTGGKPVANPCKHGLFFTLFSNNPCYFLLSSSSIFRTAMKASFRNNLTVLFSINLR
nr:MAG TPA: hypothetical protein [Caudoviricetes sp.]